MAIKTKALFPPVRSFLYIEEMKVHDNHPAKDPQVLSLHRLCFPTDSEARLVEQLHLDGDASLSLAATVSETLIGHVLFSQMKAPFRALALAPVAVTPEYRCRGIAAKLIETGIHKATKEGWQGVFVLGDPNYYGRFGFKRELARGFKCRFQSDYLMALALGSDTLPVSDGNIEYASAFSLF